MRTSAMRYSALLAARSPPRDSRWRVILPEEAGTGAAPHSAAKQFDITPPIKHSFLGALVGAVILLLIYGFVRGRTSKMKT
jgi:hypothetical protein